MLRAGIIGFGWWGKTLAGYLADSDLLRPVLVVDPAAPARAAAQAMGLETTEGFEAALCQVATPDDINQAMQLGVNYPRGPFDWAQQFGSAGLLAVLDAIFEATGDPRYRASLGLRHAADLARLQG